MTHFRINLMFYYIYFLIGMDKDDELAITLPKSWSITQCQSREGNRSVVFSHIRLVRENDCDRPITTRSIVINEQCRIQYFVYGKPIQVRLTEVVENQNDVQFLPQIMLQFQNTHICEGIRTIDTTKGHNEMYQVHDNWHDHRCKLVTKYKKSESCKRLRKSILRLKKRPTVAKQSPVRQRCSGISSSYDQNKLNALRKKLARARRTKNRMKYRVQQLKNSLQQTRNNLARIENESLEAKCKSMNLPDTQRVALREILACAKKKSKGRRYSEEWIMQCMIMNIRSPGNYDFLRKNEILPLPCARTIRGYYSLIDTKCGFDENFKKLLTKHFAKKSPLQRHGIVCLDEINLRKSISVCSKDLTYAGLTDFGDGDNSATNIREQATHGLVMMFQPLADVYTQPIAVFASKNPVNGEELAKLAIKAIIYLEQAGASIHGIVCDGAATNTKMRTMLGVTTSINETKPWFNHPLDDDRRIYVFSDLPHLIKNIRNRLYNKRVLRVCINYIYICRGQMHCHDRKNKGIL